MAEMKVADSTGIDAKIAEMAVIEDSIADMLALAEAAAEQAALVRDRYPARFYEQNVTLRSHNDLAIAGDVLGHIRDEPDASVVQTYGGAVGQ